MFNQKDRTSLRFSKVSLRQTKDGIRVAKMRFEVPLTVDVVLHCPPEVRAAYEAIEMRDNKISYVELEKVIPGVNAEFYPLPDSKSLSLVLQSVELGKLAVEREESKLRAETYLSFSVELILEEKDKLRHWLVDNVFNQLWAKFEMTQMTLMPSIAADSATKQGGQSSPVQ